MSLRTPLKQALGLGASHSGTARWWAQRVTSIALAPLLVWFLIGVVRHAGAEYASVHAWLGSPVTALLMVLMLATAFYHGALGIHVILEDYVSHETARLVLAMLVNFAAVVLAAAGVFAVLLVALGD